MNMMKKLSYHLRPNWTARFMLFCTNTLRVKLNFENGLRIDFYLNRKFTRTGFELSIFTCNSPNNSPERTTYQDPNKMGHKYSFSCKIPIIVILGTSFFPLVLYSQNVRRRFSASKIIFLKGTFNLYRINKKPGNPMTTIFRIVKFLETVRIIQCCPIDYSAIK